MGNARDGPLKYEATCMSGDVMSVHPTTIRGHLTSSNPQKYPAFHSKRCYEKCSERTLAKNVCVDHMVTWNSSSPRLMLRLTMFSPGHRRKCESRHQTWWSRQRAWPPPDDNHASSFRAVLFGVFHLLPPTRLSTTSPGSRSAGGESSETQREPSLIKIEMTLWMIKNDSFNLHIP